MTDAAYVDLMVDRERNLIFFYHSRVNGVEEFASSYANAYIAVQAKRGLPRAWVNDVRVEGVGFESVVVFDLSDFKNRSKPLPELRIRAASLYYIYFERYFRDAKDASVRSNR